MYSSWPRNVLPNRCKIVSRTSIARLALRAPGHPAQTLRYFAWKNRRPGVSADACGRRLLQERELRCNVPEIGGPSAVVHM